MKEGMEQEKRWSIITASKSGDPKHLPKLLRELKTESLANRRHIVRALGNIGHKEGVAPILEILITESGDIAGDAAEALAKLNAKEAIPTLERLTAAENTWTAQKSKWALKKLT